MTVTDGSGKPVGVGQLTGCTWRLVRGRWNCGCGLPDEEINNALFTFSFNVQDTASSYNIRIAWKTWPPISKAQITLDAWNESLEVPLNG